MKKNLLFISMLLIPFFGWSQCTTTNATDCECLDNLLTECDLLPDETVSGWAITNHLGGPNEYPQTGAGTNYTNQGPDDGRLRISGSTPNIGAGAFEVRGVDRNGYRWFLCNGDTVSLYDPTASIQFTCSNGDANPTQLLVQRIYHKNGNVMTFTEHLRGSMTYHPTHGHYHVDDWEIVTLRIATADPNPLNWPVVGTGHKIGFCLMDYYTCEGGGLNHCKDSLGNTLMNSDFPNYNLGGGSYSCSMVVQGISVGHTDVYGEHLDNQWINLPPNLCNGLYYIVIVVDPHNFFIESNDNNNVTAVPFTLTMQNPAGSGAVVEITSTQSSIVCLGETIKLTASGGSLYQWYKDGVAMPGETNQNLTVGSATANYTCDVTNYCGMATTPPFTVTEAPVPPAPTSSLGDTICPGNTATLTATGSGTIKWYDDFGTYLSTGNSLTTPVLNATETFYASNTATHNDTIYAQPEDNDMGGGAYNPNPHALKFTAYSPFTLLSVKVYANGAGNRTIQLKDSAGVTVLQSITANLPAGQSRVTLNFPITPGKYRLACAGTPNLYRNRSAGVGFDYYYVPDVFQITGSDTADAATYYYFYNWKVATVMSTCGTSVPVTAVVNNYTVALSGLNVSYLLSESSVTLTGSPAGGTFSGPGVTGSTFSPALAGVGGPYQIVYSFTDSYGCGGTDTVNVLVIDDTGIFKGYDFGSSISFYPNPATDNINFSVFIPGTSDVKIEFVNMLGQTILAKSFNNQTGQVNQPLNVESLSKGVYLVKTVIAGNSYHSRIVVE